MTSKITRKQFLASATGLAVAIPAIWRSDRAFAQGAVTLKLGHPDTPLHPTQAVATRFSEMVAAKT
ncbi:MAG TPA: TRAP transporter substrate-binding protein, partial [Xanthobacteraceae bacterium]|nr:TRAP transporter substrate-binding protein [Xanthobacteraceae bacterium]